MEWRGVSTREWALILWASVLLVIGVAFPFFRSTFAPVLSHFLRFWQLHLAIVALVAWTVGIIFLAYRLGAWDWDLLKDAIAWILVYGLATVFAAFSRAPRENRYFRRAFLSALSLSALMEFLLNLRTFNFAVEVMLQPAVTLILLLGAVAEREQRTLGVKKFMDWLLAVVGMCVFVATARGIWASWHSINPKQTALSFAFSIWLPLAMLPFVYLLALTTTYSTIFRLGSFRNDERRPSMLVKAAIVFGLHGHLRAVNDLPQYQPQLRAIVHSQGFKEALGHVRDYEQARYRKLRGKEIDAARLGWYVGNKSRRADGTQLDQREFKETKAALRWVQTCQLGRYNSKARYQANLMESLADFMQEGLPAEHGIAMRVRKDGQAWYAWRQTVSGFVLGIGADKGRSNEWLYEGWNAPKGFPGTDPSWGDTPYETPPNWR